MPYKTKKLRFIFIIYWFFLAYVIAALVFWFMELNRQNRQMAHYKRTELEANDIAGFKKINGEQRRKTAQYIGEGSAFFLLIIAGAIFIFRAVRRQLKSSQQQQHFMMALAHELKTPIAVVKLNLETVQKRKLDELQQKKLLQNILQEANRLDALCNNMLLSSQIEAGGYSITREEINFSELVKNCIYDFSVRYPQRDIQLNTCEDIFINGDGLLLQLMINNLIDNAIKYSPKESGIQILLSEKNKKIYLEIKDEGTGIPKEEREKIFKKYYRIGNVATKGAKGTGLGLYLTKKIVQQHRGDIFVTNNYPTGTIFTVIFPVG